jgi:DNA-binding MarR family transcriptional regulator
MAGVLWALDPAKPAVPMRELARRLRCDPSNVTLIGDRLEQAGLVVRRPHPSDGRSRILALTASGLERRAQLLQRLLDTTPLKGLSPRERRPSPDRHTTGRHGPRHRVRDRTAGRHRGG